MKLLDKFPKGQTPRQQQIEILNGIDKALAKNKKFIVIQAPTGCGKSHIAATLAKASNNPTPAFIQTADNHNLFQKLPAGGYKYASDKTFQPFGTAVLTCTKVLQNQYDALFTDSFTLKGKQNYVCAVDEDFDCDIAPCTPAPKVLERCKSTNNCPFLNARRDTLKARFSVYNYAAYLTLPQFLQRKQYLICDEASELEDELVKRYSCSIDYQRGAFKKLKLQKLHTDDRNIAFRWLNDVLSELNRHHESISAAFNTKSNKRKLMSDINQLRQYKQLIERITLVVQNWFNSEYVIEYSAKEVKFTPLYVNVLAQQFFKEAETVILMSGTIIDHEQFCKTLGITDYEYIEVDSEFDPKHSPIYCSNKFKLNHKNLDEHLPTLTKLVMRICQEYPKDKGIIHTHTFKITEAVKKSIQGDKRFLFREPGITNEIILQEHQMTKNPTVLISPSLGFGTDLADDHGRFSIIMKTPYLPLGDKRIKTLFERNKRWYQMKALVYLVQMCGRTTRNVDDYSDTYILDGTAVDLIKRNSDKLPIWFRKRLQ